MSDTFSMQSYNETHMSCDGTSRCEKAFIMLTVDLSLRSPCQIIVLPTG